MSNSTITKKEEWDAIAAEFYPYFINWIKAHATSVDEIETYNSLIGVKSLPARLDLGGVRKNVLVPLSAITAHTDDSAENANQAAQRANNAAANAEVAANKANEAVERVNESIDGLESVKNDVLDACNDATLAANRANDLSDHPPKIGSNKNWWIWNENLREYVDSNIIAEGNFLYSNIQIDPETMHLIIHAPKELGEPMFELDQVTGHLILKLS